MMNYSYNVLEDPESPLQSPGKTSPMISTKNIGNLRFQLTGHIDFGKINFKKTSKHSQKWVRPIPEKFEERSKITTLSKDKRRERARQLWVIGIRKARTMVIIMKAIKSVDDNIKIFGVSKNINDDLSFDTGHNGVKCCMVIDPNGKFSKFWALITTFTLMLTGLYVPYSAAFLDDQGFDFFSLVLDIPFYFDIIFGFFTGYRTAGGNFESRLIPLVFNYLRTWFFIDLCTIIPYEVLFSNNTFSFIKFIKFLKVFKFIRVFKYVNRIKEIAAKYDISIITLRLLAEAIAVVYLVHIAACIYFFIAVIEGIKY